MQVKGRDYQLLNDALVDAFRPDSLEAMLQFGLGERLDVLVAPARFDHLVFQLIEVYNRRDQVEKLVQAARRFNPTNGRLHQVAQQLGRATQVTAHVADGVAPVDAWELEKLVRRHVPLLPAGAMREQMQRVEGRVCLVERRLAGGQGQARGSGFLVGPAAVLTNYHVAQGFLEGDQARQLQVRFDALLREDGVREPNEGVVVAVEAIPVAQPFSPADVDESQGPPAPEELDFAILRLADEAGRAPVGGAAGPLQSRAERGWVTLPEPDPVLEPGDPLIIYQYPGGRELMMAIDTEAVVGLVWGGARVRYRANTERGSSGSPVFNFAWELVALHHAGSPGPEPVPYNQGIPIARIKAALAARGLTPLLGL